jgi:predicted glycoside hydrolase/deacetylase ChbG (UPF0249 family)
LRRGLLIVNADDWGGYPEMTDATLRCFEAGAISSTTAMMYMQDSDRAAELALSAGIPTGLHLNLTQPFEDPATPSGVRERQRKLTTRFRRRQLRRWTYDPSLRGLFERVIFDQFERFHELYGRAPVHVDGHEHAHLAFNVIFCSALDKGTALRCGGTVTGSPARRLRQWILKRRFRTPDLLRGFESFYPRWDRLSEELAVAHERSLEVSTHPGWPDNYARLLSSQWIDALSEHRLGSYADLPVQGASLSEPAYSSGGR